MTDHREILRRLVEAANHAAHCTVSKQEADDVRRNLYEALSAYRAAEPEIMRALEAAKQTRMENYKMRGNLGKIRTQINCLLEELGDIP